MSLETELRDALASRADDLDAPAFDPYERVAGAIVTSRRRRRAAAVGAVAAVAAIAVLVPGLAQGDHRSTLPAKRTQVVVPGPNDPRWSAMSSWPVRGSLAEDKELIKAVAEKFGTSHVLYAGDLDRTRVVVGWDPEDGGSSRVTMFAGSRGTGVDGMSEVSSASGGNTDLVVLRESDDKDSRLVTLTTPSTRTLSLSKGLQIATDGTVTRDPYRQVALTDGVYSEDLKDSPPHFMRVEVPGGTSDSTPARLTGLPRQQREDMGSICLNCTGEDFRVKAEQGIGAGVAVDHGLSPTQVQTTTVYFGAVDRTIASRLGMNEAKGGTTRLMVTDTTLPQGQVLRSALVVDTAKDGSAATTMELATGVPIDAGTAAVRPYVLHGGGAETGTMSFQVFAPNAARVRLVSSTPSLHPSTAKLPTPEGTALTTTPNWSSEQRPPYAVEVYDAAGAKVGQWPLDLPSEDVWTAGTAP
ncbi:hypothetical protein ABEG17_06255 [Pedococcus sp. KACC 23699]|uniref:DUF4179 domain-containing protein n=1 Tax=Pedococcus sp. KACC 23699 TaxID=3149228 RepID=A0AAU7JWX7_9MICO